MKKILLGLALTIIATTSFAQMSKYPGLTEEQVKMLGSPTVVIKDYGYRIGDAVYEPQKGKLKKSEEPKVLQEIQAMIDLDNKITQAYKDNPALIPFKDFKEEYRTLFKKDRAFFQEILLGYFSKATVDKYVAFKENHLKNFEQNMNLLKDKGEQYREKYKKAQDTLTSMKENYEMDKDFIKRLTY